MTSIKFLCFAFVWRSLHLALWVEREVTESDARERFILRMLTVSQEWSIRTGNKLIMGKLSGIVTRLRAGWLRNGGSILGRIKKMFLLCAAFKLAVGAIQLPVQCVLEGFYLWVLHPVAHLSNWFFMTPSIATKFQYINSLLFSFSLHVSAPRPSSGETYN
jgi:hypothetical protein